MNAPTRSATYYRVRATVRFFTYMALVAVAFIGPHALVAALTA